MTKPFNSIERQRLLAYGLQHGQFLNPLYKYTTVANLRLMLENGTIKFSRITDFNDKRECFATLDFNCTRSDWANYIISLNPELPIRQLAAMVNSVVSNPDLGRRWITAAIKDTNRNLGILCLTVRNDNNLMWAHYADSHRGVCLRFDISRDLDTFCFPKQVTYDDKVMKFNYIRSWNLRKGADVTEAIFHKSAEWSYEQEYRVCASTEQASSPSTSPPSVPSVSASTLPPTKSPKSAPSADAKTTPTYLSLK